MLIDGSHSFPSVFIDWYYTADKLRVGGWLVIDDTAIWTVRVLRDFLRSEKEWELVSEFPMQTAFFRKIAPTNGVRNWIYQPYVIGRSLLNRRRRVAAMLRDRDFPLLMEKARNRLRGGRVR